MPTCAFIGAPIETGTSRRGCGMGPASLRTAGIVEAARDLGWEAIVHGDLAPPQTRPSPHSNPAIHHLSETCAWITALSDAAFAAARQVDLPIFLGGDHSLSAGTISGLARHAAQVGRPLFVLWLDAHPDFHDLDSTKSGNLHGTPAAYVTGQGGFDAYPALPHPVSVERFCMMGLRSVDRPEHDRLLRLGLEMHDMRRIDETGVLPPLQRFLDRVQAEDGLLHVSFDVDFLDPSIAPAVGTTVPGGASFREAHLIMETLCDSGRVTSLDLVELNPFLDERGRTASLLVDLTASLLGRRVFDRPTQSFAA